MSIGIQEETGEGAALGKEQLSFLLIAPRISPLPYPNNLTELPEHEKPVIPHGFAYISSSIKAICNNVHNLNLEFESGDVEETIRDTVKKYDIDVVLTTGLSGQFSKIKHVVDCVKSIDPEIFVILGGGIITSSPEVAMKAFGNVDVGVIGEGEFIARDLVTALNAGESIENIDGIIYRKNGEFISTPPRSELSDLESLPLPDYKGLGYDKLWNAERGVMVVAARSCPFNCTFCFHPSGSSFRRRSVDDVIEEIRNLVSENPIKDVGVIGESYFSSPSRVKEFCEKIKPLNVRWTCTVHASGCRKELLEMMRDAGCVLVCIGIESACDKILKSMNKKVNFKQVEEALNTIRESGISVTGNFIFGDIEEDMGTVEKTLAWWRQNRKFPISLIWINVFPGTAMYKYALEKGIIEDEIEYLRTDCPTINISKLTMEQRRELAFRFSTDLAFYTHPPKDFKIISCDIANRQTTVSFSCGCGKEMNVVATGILLSEGFICPSCRQTFSMPFHEKYSTDYARKKMEALLAEYGHVAFWGIGIEMQLLLKMLDIAEWKNVTFIDKDERKQGLPFLGHTIEPPSVLASRDIGVVIPTPVAGMRHAGIIEGEVAKYCDAEIVSFEKFLNLKKETVGNLTHHE